MSARKTFWNIETNEARKVAGPYATIEAALQARWFFPTVPKLYVVEYETDDCPLRAAPTIVR
jgi:hypothetical protein